MSSFIEAIKQSGTDSLDVIMKNGRYIVMLELMQTVLDICLKHTKKNYHLKKALDVSTTTISKGIYEAIEVTDLLEVRTDVDVEKGNGNLEREVSLADWRQRKAR